MTNKQKNEYRESLDLYRQIQSEERNLIRSGKRTEEDCISFLLKLKKLWPKMYAIEQQYQFYQWLSFYAASIDSMRNGTGRNSVWSGGNYIGMFGKERNMPKGLAVDIFDYKVHKGRPGFSLYSLEEMAKAIEEYETNKAVV